MIYLSQMDCLRLLAPIASPDTRIYVHEAMKRVKAGEKNVVLEKFTTASVRSVRIP